MGLIIRIIIGGLGTALGIILVSKTEWWVNNFGRIAWAERHLSSSGGSRLMYKMIGLLIIFLSFIYVTGFWISFMKWLLGPLLKFGGR
jgi:hypothetical protein